jgi:V/A-type H+-transporting ATPase subunit I
MEWLTPATAFIVGEQLLYGGLIVAIVLSIVQTGFSGLASVFKIVEVFADTLSYLRLYALGLASMVLAGTFNEMGAMVGGYVFGAIIIVLGHMINIGLGVGAGVIHGLRLNFLEWYHHSFEGGGKKFNPLRLLVRRE